MYENALSFKFFFKHSQLSKINIEYDLLSRRHYQLTFPRIITL